jgi:type III pantothenate kinase
MLLAVDIGNTNISFGLFKGGRLVRRFDLSSQAKNKQALLRKKLSGARVDDAVICSVVPALTVELRRLLSRLLHIKPHIIGRDIKVPIKNLYRKPMQVGQDRLVNAYAASKLYGAPLVVIDFGTAVTFDVVSKNREYLGGMILPGLGISLDALAQRTALLPKIKLANPSEFIGRDTKNSMLSGIVYGFTALTDDLAGRIKGKIGRDSKVIATGGNISLIGRYCRSINKIDKNLTLRGLSLIYQSKFVLTGLRARIKIS